MRLNFRRMVIWTCLACQVCLASLLLSGCGLFRRSELQQPTSGPILTFTPYGGIPARTATPSPTARETPAPSYTPTPAFPYTLTPTPSLTPDPLLAQAKFLGISWQPHYELMISIQFPAPVKADAYTVTLQDSRYTCQVLAQYPDRYYCLGPARNVSGLATLRIYQPGSKIPGYQKDLSIPWFDQ